jgi:hypothetical protein
MNALAYGQCIGSPDNAIIAQIDISDAEIAALGRLIARFDGTLGLMEVAVFALATGDILSLSKTEGIPSSRLRLHSGRYRALRSPQPVSPASRA